MCISEWKNDQRVDLKHARSTGYSTLTLYSSRKHFPSVGILGSDCEWSVFWQSLGAVLSSARDKIEKKRKAN